MSVRLWRWTEACEGDFCPGDCDCCSKNTEDITCIEDYAGHLGIEVADLERAMYKYTACGAWITWNETSMTIGSIVEGSDAEFLKTFTFPTTTDTIGAWIDELERLTDEAWHEANDEEEEES